jgi:hypothetical protein
LDIYIGSDLTIAVYIDNILIIGRSKEIIQKFKNIFKRKYNIKKLGEAQNYLRIEIIKNRKIGKLRISQKKYLQKILKRFNMEFCNPINIIIPEDITINLEDTDYLDEIGLILY